MNSKYTVRVAAQTGWTEHVLVNAAGHCYVANGTILKVRRHQGGAVYFPVANILSFEVS